MLFRSKSDMISVMRQDPAGRVHHVRDVKAGAETACMRIAARAFPHCILFTAPAK